MQGEHDEGCHTSVIDSRAIRCVCEPNFYDQSMSLSES